MSLGWIIAVSIIGGLFVLDIASKIIINHTNWLCRVFENDIAKKIHYFCSIIIFYAFFVVFMFAFYYSKIYIGFYIIGIIGLLWLIGSIFDTLLFDITGLRKRNRFGVLSRLYKFGCILDFVVFVFISIFILYNIPNSNLQNVIISVYSAVIGGGLTLVGVIITIKRQEKENKEQDRLRYYPYFNIYMNMGKKIDFDNCYLIDAAVKEIKEEDIYKTTIKDNEMIYHMDTLVFQNSDHSSFVIDKITINDKPLYKKQKLVLKNEKFDIANTNYFISEKDKLPEIKLYISDMLKNNYIFKIDFQAKVEERTIKDFEGTKKFQYCSLNFNSVIEQ